MAIKILARITLLLIPAATFAQNIITGRVVDSDTREPVKDAIVTVVATKVQAKANYKGYFQVAADSADVLTIQHTGYIPGQIKVPGRDGFQVSLTKDLAPEYSGGMDLFYEYLSQSLEYPAKARQKGTQGRIYISFDVDSLEGIQNIMIVSDIGHGCAQTIVNSLSKAPNRWIPKAKVVSLILPVTFQLGGRGSSLELGEVGTDVQLPKGIVLKEIVVTARTVR